MKHCDDYFVGQRFGRITVGFIHHRKHGKIYVNCLCDCGNKKIISMDSLRRGVTKSCGCLNKELLSKRLKGRTGKKSHVWDGGSYTSSNGYTYIYLEDKNRKSVSKYIGEHVLVAEKAIGKTLPCGSIVHHFDGNKSNNMNSNLVVCENNAYHRLLHKRQRAKLECGNANWHKCYVCGEWDCKENLYIGKSEIAHRDCKNKKLREWRGSKK